MAKTIADYQREYQEARARGDSAGMQAANDGANAIRQASGQTPQYATSDINKTKQSASSKVSNSSLGSVTGSIAGGPIGGVIGGILGGLVDKVTGGGSSSSTSKPAATGNVSASGSYTQKYTPGTNAALDAALKPYQDQYNAARLAGDAAGMQAANTAANQIRNQYGYASENAYVDIGKVAGQSGGISGGASGYWPDAQTPVQDMSNYLEEMYEAQRRQAIAQLNSAYQNNLNALNQSTVGVDARYQNARNQAAGASELSARNFAEYAAASGLNSGAAGQAELARNVALQSDLTGLSQDEANFYSNIELQKQQAEVDYNNAIAEAEASNDYAAAQALYQEKVRVQNSLIEQQIQQMQMDLQKQSLALQEAQQNTANQQWQQQFDYNKQATETDRLISLGQSMLDAGLMPSSDALTAMGITSQQAQQYIDYVNLIRSLQTQQEQAQLSAYKSRSNGVSSSGGSSSKSSKSSSGSSSYSGGTKSSSGSSSGGNNQNVSVDLGSVVNLGRGPVSAQGLSDLVDSGEVGSYTDGNQIKFYNTGKKPTTTSGGALQYILDQGKNFRI